MPFEGAVLPQVEAEPAGLGLARSPVTRRCLFGIKSG